MSDNSNLNTMKALSKAKPEVGLWMGEHPIPEIGSKDVLIKISKTAICGTDLHIWNWDDWAQKTIPVPMITGHEFVGEIVDFGNQVNGFSIGQRVTGEGHLVGDSSRASRSGRFHMDPETRGIGVNEPGAFAEYLRMPAFNVIPLPDDISDEVGAILDPLGNAVHTALSYDLTGEDVLITGAGPIGIMAAVVARHVGARSVVITDINQERLDLASAFSGIVTVNVNHADLKDVQHELGMTEGFDIGLEMSGVSSAFDQMTDSLVMGGKIAMLGIPAKKTLVDWSTVVFKAITIKGVYGREMFNTWYKMIAMLQSGLDVSKIITDILPIEKFEEGFQKMNTGKCGKVLLDWAKNK